MTRLKAWRLCLAAGLLSLVNFGNCCCLFGFPVGIWSYVVLSLDDVTRKFKSRHLTASERDCRFKTGVVSRKNPASRRGLSGRVLRTDLRK